MCTTISGCRGVFPVEISPAASSTSTRKIAIVWLRTRTLQVNFMALAQKWLLKSFLLIHSEGLEHSYGVQNEMKRRPVCLRDAVHNFRGIEQWNPNCPYMLLTLTFNRLNRFGKYCENPEKKALKYVRYFHYLELVFHP